MILFSMSLMMRILSIDLCMRLSPLDLNTRVFNVTGVLWAGIHHR
jgi:hypothetical protein